MDLGGNPGDRWLAILHFQKTREPYEEIRYITALRNAGSPLVNRNDRLLEKADSSTDNPSEITF